MLQTTVRSRKIFIMSVVLIMAVSLISTQVAARSSSRPPTRVTVVQGQPEAGPLHLALVFDNDTLVGTVTVSSKDNRPWADVRGQAYLLNSAGERLAVIPLQPLGPGEFRLIAPLGKLASASGYLDIQLPGNEQAAEVRGVYQVDRANRTLVWAKSAPDSPTARFPQSAGGPDAFGYVWDDTTTYSWIDTSGGTSVSLRDDDWAGPFPLGFTFNFYGQNYTQFYIDSNGYIGFDPTQKASYWSNVRLPSAHRPNNVVAPFWEDFDPTQGGVIRYRTVGTSPNQMMVVEWSNVPIYGTSELQSFQLILYEGSNNIKYQYPATRHGDSGYLFYATACIENDDGTIGLEYPYLIPITTTRAVQFNYNRPAYNVFLTPWLQGSSAAAGASASFHVLVKNLGTNADTYTLSRSAYSGADWAVSFYQSDGITPLAGNSTGSIAAGAQKDIVAKVNVLAGASIGSWSRVAVRTTSQTSGTVQSTVVLDAMNTPSFYQAYVDDYSGDGTEDSENYIDPIVAGAHRSMRLTTDLDNSNYAGITAMPDGNAVTVWNTNYTNNNSISVSDVQYAVVDQNGSFVRPITRLTNNSAATQRTFDFSPAPAVAPNGNILIGWALQKDTNGDRSIDRYDAWYTIVSRSGGTIKVPTALTNNASDYPRDYPPSVVALINGNFLLTWEHAASSSGPVDIHYAVLDSNGNIVKGPTRLTGGGGLNVTPGAASFPNGKAAIVWISYNTDGNGEVYYAVLNADGTSPNVLTPITANGANASSSDPDVAALADGQLAVAWTQATTDFQIQYKVVTGEPPVPSSWTTIASQDFEGAFPGAWQVFDNDGTTNGEYQWAKRNCKSYAGSYSGWAVGGGANGAVLTCGANYPNNADSWMVYGPFSLTDATASDLQFKLWLNSETSYDQICRLASINGTNFFGTCTTGNSGGWIDKVLDLSNVYNLGNLMGQSNVWVALVYSSDASNNYPEGAYVDNIVLRKCTSPSCPATNITRSISGDGQSVESPKQVMRALSSTATNTSVQPQAALATIYTVPNAVSGANNYVSLSISPTVNHNDLLIMTWLDDANTEFVLYALANQTGTILTPATVLQRTRHSNIWSSWNGYGNAYMPLQVNMTVKVYLPVVLKGYPPVPPPPPVTNGGFETGNLYGWTAGGGVGLVPQVVTSQRRTGSYAALLGQEGAPCESSGGLIGSSWIYQDITVPSSGSAQLTFYYRIFTYDKLNADKYDSFEVYINGTLLNRMGNTTPSFGCSKPINDLNWQLFAYDLSAYRGQTVRLQLVNTTRPDGWYGTWTYVDDVVIGP